MTEPLDLLHTCLLELLYELQETTITLTLGGGYGLFLKRQQVALNAKPTLIGNIQEARSTNDLDLFLRTELLANPKQSRYFAEILVRLGFEAVETAKFYQFCRKFGELNQEYTVKIDLLTGPLSSTIDPARLRIEDDRRLKPRDKTIPLHARRTEEAVAIEESPLSVVIQGHRFNGEEIEAVIFLPNVFSYLLMKIHAFDDKESRGERENASKHAADVYQILAMTTEQEWETAKRLQAHYATIPVVRDADLIVQKQFTSASQPGIIRLREYSVAFRQVNIAEFSSILTELFSPE